MAKKRVHVNKKWRGVVFIDEKKFSLEGPDGLHYYCHDLRKEQQLLNRWPMEDSGIMIWGGIGGIKVRWK